MTKKTIPFDRQPLPETTLKLISAGSGKDPASRSSPVDLDNPRRGPTGPRLTNPIQEDAMTKKTVDSTAVRLTAEMLKQVSAGAGGTTKGGDVPVTTG